MALSKFGAAFRAARKAGKKVFTWNGKRYNTRLKGEGKTKKSPNIKGKVPLPRSKPAKAKTTNRANIGRPKAPKASNKVPKKGATSKVATRANIGRPKAPKATSGSSSTGGNTVTTRANIGNRKPPVKKVPLPRRKPKKTVAAKSASFKVNKPLSNFDDQGNFKKSKTTVKKVPSPRRKPKKTVAAKSASFKVNKPLSNFDDQGNFKKPKTPKKKKKRNTGNFLNRLLGF